MISRESGIGEDAPLVCLWRVWNRIIQPALASEHFPGGVNLAACRWIWFLTQKNYLCVININTCLEEQMGKIF